MDFPIIAAIFACGVVGMIIMIIVISIKFSHKVKAERASKAASVTLSPIAEAIRKRYTALYGMADIVGKYSERIAIRNMAISDNMTMSDLCEALRQTDRITEALLRAEEKAPAVLSDGDYNAAREKICRAEKILLLSVLAYNSGVGNMELWTGEGAESELFSEKITASYSGVESYYRDCAENYRTDSLPPDFDGEEYAARIKKTRALKRGLRIALAAADVIIAALLLTALPTEVAIPIIVMLLLLTGVGLVFIAIIGISAGKDRGDIFSEYYAKRFIQNVYYEADCQGTSELRELVESVDMHFEDDMDSISGGAHIKGRYRGIDVEWGDFDLGEKHRDSDGHTSISHFFTGQYILLDPRKSFPANMLIYGRDRSVPLGENLTENGEFNEMYTSEDSFSLRRLDDLTLNTLVAIGAHTTRGDKGPARIACLPDGRLLIASDSEHNLILDAKSAKAQPEEINKAVNDYFCYVCGIIDRLLIGLE